MQILIAIPPQTNLETRVDELVAAARKIQTLCAAEIQIAMAGPDANENGEKTAKTTGIDVISVPVKNTAGATAETLTGIFSGIVAEISPGFILFPHTAAGLDIAPALASEIGAACITGVEKIEAAGGNIRFTREIFNGKLTTHLAAETPITVATIQIGIFARDDRNSTGAGTHSVRRFNEFKSRSRLKGIRKEVQDSASLDQAEVLVAAGNGIGEKENLELIHQLAGLFAKSAVCGSRPVCDKNWLPHRRQVGITGSVVSPKLYIACGISGASQHIAGIRQAKFIVAINKDPRAAICNFSDVCVIEDLKTFIPLLIEAYKASQPGGPG